MTQLTLFAPVAADVSTGRRRSLVQLAERVAADRVAAAQAAAAANRHEPERIGDLVQEVLRRHDLVARRAARQQARRERLAVSA